MLPRLGFAHARALAAPGFGLNSTELGVAINLFAGPLEQVAESTEDIELRWLESPLWADGNEETGEEGYLLFSDVPWEDEQNVTCGMIWRYTESEGVTEFLRCSGLVGPGETPSNIADFKEGGSNGLHWGWRGTGDLLIAQHGKSRIVRIDVSDVVNGTIDPDRVAVLVDSYNGTGLNAPNDLTFLGDVMYFTDPPFGRQLSTDDPNAIRAAFDNIPQDGIGIYTVEGDPSSGAPVEPTRLLTFDNTIDPWESPNGIAVTDRGDVVTPITAFSEPADPRVEYFTFNSTNGMVDATPNRLELQYRRPEDGGFPAMTDGITYSPELDILFTSGPGGVYIHNATSFVFLGFLRIPPLSANNGIGGGYLWMTAWASVWRIPLNFEFDPMEEATEEGDVATNKTEADEAANATDTDTHETGAVNGGPNATTNETDTDTNLTEGVTQRSTGQSSATMRGEVKIMTSIISLFVTTLLVLRSP